MPTDLYLDYCATTPLHPQVLKAVQVGLEMEFGNPSSMHLYGRKARQLVEEARELVASGIGASPEEVIVTSGATESNNLALIGTLRQLSPKKTHLITTAIEHHAILHCAEALERDGYQLTILPVDSNGRVSPEDLRESIQPKTALISIMLVNNEIGTLQELQPLTRIAHEHGILFHTDAVQALPCLNVDVESLGVDLLSLSGHKIYGPKGIGALYLRDGTELEPLYFGGSQERKLRPGTENVPGILGLGAAMSLRSVNLASRYDHLQQLRKKLIRGLKDLNPGCTINGSLDQVSPHVISVSFQGVDGELLLFHLSQQGVAVSLGSACTAENLEPSHVLTAIGLPLEQISSTVRISLGEPTTSQEIERFLHILPSALEKSSLN
jgi:cysteine desulfurase